MNSVKDWRAMLDGKLYISAEDFPQKPDGAILLVVGGYLRVLTTPEKLGKAIVDLFEPKYNTLIEIDPKEKNR